MLTALANVFDLVGTLVVNFQNNVLALLHALGNGCFGCSVAVLVHMGPFDKGPLRAASTGAPLEVDSWTSRRRAEPRPAKEARL
jgi:hypothetical protein